jgi:hypothetical protein
VERAIGLEVTPSLLEGGIIRDYFYYFGSAFDVLDHGHDTILT